MVNFGFYKGIRVIAKGFVKNTRTKIFKKRIASLCDNPHTYGTELIRGPRWRYVAVLVRGRNVWKSSDGERRTKSHHIDVSL